MKGANRRPEKIGEAFLPLSRVLTGDSSFQAQEIRCDAGHLGKIFYRTRMRQPLPRPLNGRSRRARSKVSLSQQSRPALLLGTPHSQRRPLRWQFEGVLVSREMIQCSILDQWFLSSLSISTISNSDLQMRREIIQSLTLPRDMN